MRAIKAVIVALIWIIGIVCALVMKKVQPSEFWPYLLYDGLILIAFTIFAVSWQ